MKIIKIGTFDENGQPTGWSLSFNGGDGKAGQYCLGISTGKDSLVTVNGIEIVEWTEARKQAMKHDIAKH